MRRHEGGRGSGWASDAGSEGRGRDGDTKGAGVLLLPVGRMCLQAFVGWFDVHVEQGALQAFAVGGSAHSAAAAPFPAP